MYEKFIAPLFSCDCCGGGNHGWYEVIRYSTGAGSTGPIGPTEQTIYGKTNYYKNME